jgi:hypothetical protein
MLLELRRAALFARRRYWRGTNRLRLLPTFLIIGTQTAATLPLFRALRRHPEVAGPRRAHENISLSSELHFFDLNFARGINWYRSCFPLVARRFWWRRRGRDLLAGEATPAYLFHPAVPDRVAATLPDVQLIALLRDPIERAYWDYDSRHLRGLELLSFEDALAAEAEGAARGDVAGRSNPRSHGPYAYVERGLYADQLERWLTFFPRDQLLVLRAEDFVTRPSDTYAIVLDFLGLAGRKPPPIQLPRWTPAPIEPALRVRLEERFAEPNARLARLLGQDFGWDSRPAGATEAAARSPS